MPKFVALLRAVNVGGTGKLPMSDLKSICNDAGFAQVQTYIASGNVVFDSKLSSARVQAELEKRLLAYSEKPIGVLIRTAAELKSAFEANPFTSKEPNRTIAHFIFESPPMDALDHISGQADEELSLGKREIYVYYPSGIGNSKLRIPAAKNGTARNMNTFAKLVEMTTKS